MWFRKQKSFPHGIHPPSAKETTQHLPIQQFPFAPMMLLSLAQHIGKPAVAIVRESEEVLRGQPIARADGFLSVPIHAPATGTIKRIALVPSIGGTMVPGIYLEPFPASTQEIAPGEPCLLENATADDIVHAIQDAGIVGLGGAAFPTHAKLTPPADKTIDTLIINGVECEPYLTTDHRVMLEQTDDIFTGVRYLLKATRAHHAVIAVEANKQDAADALSANKPAGLPLSIEVLPVKYPQGAEKMLIKAAMDREVPTGKHAFEVGVVSVNIATTAEIGRLLPQGRGIQERVITIAGPAIENKGNYRIPIGTPLRFVLETVGLRDDVSRVFSGGPMMGQAVPNLDIPITKGTSGIIAFTEAQTGKKTPEYPCIHCGFCVDACPMSLNPSQLGLLANTADYSRMVDDFHLMDCFECGACAYVCPAHIPLVHRFRVAKAQIRKQTAT